MGLVWIPLWKRNALIYWQLPEKKALVLAQLLVYTLTKSSIMWPVALWLRYSSGYWWVVICIQQSLHLSPVAHQAGDYPLQHEVTRSIKIFILSRWMIVDCRVTPSIKFTGTYLIIQLSTEMPAKSKGVSPPPSPAPHPP